MSLSLIVLAASAAAATHHVDINHHGKRVQTTYTARVEIRTRTVGAKTPNRMDMQRCQWTATVVVNRQLPHSPALSRTLSTDKALSGSESGACTANRKIGERHLAQHQAKIDKHLHEIAERDRASLLAELDAVRNLASN